MFGPVLYRAPLQSQDPSHRPYLWLRVWGLNGQSGALYGLIDSGADNTSFPASLIPLMGYQADQLEPTTVGQVQGTAPGWQAKEPCRALVVGLEDLEFELRPLFVEGSFQILWGRADFFRTFGVQFDEAGQRFWLSTPDSPPS